MLKWTAVGEGLDLARTLFARAEIQPPDQFKGRDLLSTEPPEAVYSTIGFGYTHSKAFPYSGIGEFLDGQGWPRRACIRTARYRFDRTVRIAGREVTSNEKDPFLADVALDPEEYTNIANDPRNKAVVAELSQMLDRHMEKRIEPPAAYVQ